MAGFDLNDPADDDRWGYRADFLRTSGGIVSYNGYAFPPALSSGVTVVPEYDDAGRTVKYITVAISIKFIHTDTSADITQAGIPGTSYEQLSPVIATDLRTRLSQPCQTLMFTAQGFGDFIVNGVSAGSVQDVDYGPKPQVLEWKPLGGGNAAEVEWLCTTRIPACSKIGPFIQLSYNISWGIDDTGFIFKTVEGFVEIPSTRSATVGSTNASPALNTNFTAFNQLRLHLAKLFPFHPKFKRQFFFRLRNNKKFIDFKIEDVEIRSSSMMLPGAAEVELNQNISASLEDGGFTKWKVTYSGRIDAVNLPGQKGGVPEAKKLAWAWLGKLIVQKRLQFQNHIRNNADKMSPEEKEEILDMMGKGGLFAPPLVKDTFNEVAIVYPTYISITDSLYSNILLFTISYIAFTTTSLINKALGLFDSVKIDGLSQDTWIRTIEEGKVTTARIEFDYPRSDLVIDLCHTPSATEPSTSDTKTTESRREVSISSIEAPEEGKDWKDYQNSAIYYSDEGTVVSGSLSPQVEPTTENLGPIKGGKFENEDDNNPFPPTDPIPAILTPQTGTSQSTPEISVYKPAKGVTMVRMVGHAVRFGGKISPPRLLGAGAGVVYNVQTGEVTIAEGQGGAIAHRIGRSKVLHSTRKIGLLRNGKPIVEHTCRWDLWYVLDRIPRGGIYKGKEYSPGTLRISETPHRYT